MANYQKDLSTEPGEYLNGHAVTAKELRKGQSAKRLQRSKMRSKERSMRRGK